LQKLSRRIVVAPAKCSRIRMRFRALHGCVFDPHFSLPSGAPVWGPYRHLSFHRSLCLHQNSGVSPMKMWSCRCRYYCIIILSGISVQIKHSLIMQNCMHSTKRAKYSSPLINSVTIDFDNFRDRCCIIFYTLLNFT